MCVSFPVNANYTRLRDLYGPIDIVWLRSVCNACRTLLLLLLYDRVYIIRLRERRKIDDDVHIMCKKKGGKINTRYEARACSEIITDEKTCGVLYDKNYDPSRI